MGHLTSGSRAAGIRERGYSDLQITHPIKKGPTVAIGPSANHANTDLLCADHVFKCIFGLTRGFPQLGKPMLACHAQIGKMQCHAKTHV